MQSPERRTQWPRAIPRWQQAGDPVAGRVPATSFIRIARRGRT